MDGLSISRCFFFLLPIEEIWWDGCLLKLTLRSVVLWLSSYECDMPAQWCWLDSKNVHCIHWKLNIHGIFNEYMRVWIFWLLIAAKQQKNKNRSVKLFREHVRNYISWKLLLRSFDPLGQLTRSCYRWKDQATKKWILVEFLSQEYMFCDDWPSSFWDSSVQKKVATPLFCPKC